MNSRAWAEAPAAVTRVDPAAPAAGRVNNSKELRSGGQVAQLIQSTNNFSGPSAAAYKRWKMTGQLPEEVVQERTFGRTTAASNRAADSFRALDEAAPQPAQLSRQPLRENPVTWTYGEGASAFTERPAPPPAPAPAPPPPTYDATPVIDTLQALISRCSAFNLAPMDVRKMQDISKRVGGLADKLRAGGLSQAVFDKLSELCRALAAGDQRTALDAHTHITNADWADNGPWLMGLKRLIEMSGKLQVTL